MNNRTALTIAFATDLDSAADVHALADRLELLALEAGTAGDPETVTLVERALRGDLGAWDSARSLLVS
jgi:hypothetical protein